MRAEPTLLSRCWHGQGTPPHTSAEETEPAFVVRVRSRDQPSLLIPARYCGIVSAVISTGPNKPDASNGEFARYGLKSVNVYFFVTFGC